MGKFYFRFLGPYKAGPCLNAGSTRAVGSRDIVINETFSHISMIAENKTSEKAFTPGQF